MKLQATLRTVTGKKVNAYRKQGKIPAVIYSKYHSAAITIFVEKNAFLRLYKEAGTSTPVQIIGEGIDELVLIHKVLAHPVTTMLTHIDFLGVKKDVAVHAEVHLEYIGESPAEKEKIGRVQTLLDSVEVVAKPMDLPKSLQVDLSGLHMIHDVLFVKDIVVPKGVKIENDPDQAVVTVVALSEEKEEVETSTEVEAETSIEE